jgi:hypothetical protein
MAAWREINLSLKARTFIWNTSRRHVNISVAYEVESLIPVAYLCCLNVFTRRAHGKQPFNLKVSLNSGPVAMCD